MQRFLAMKESERRELLEAAGTQLGLPAASVEKDFWVTWTLREMFDLPEWGPQLTFKGGTSLSKCWKLIDRFSEDIDLVVDREFLGFGGELRGKKLKKLRPACSTKIRASLLPALQVRWNSVLPSAPRWALEPADRELDPDGQTLMFRYPTVLPDQQGYLAPVVRIELGARSDTEPQDSPKIRTLLAEAFPDLLRGSEFPVRAVAARRTFWEKALLLHEETYRPAARGRERMSRHYYDVYRLVERGVADEALADVGLLQRIVEHRRVFFSYTWMDYATMRKGTLRLVPLPEQERAWREDYQAMRTQMFYGEPPGFDEVLAAVRTFQDRFNAQ
jgi:predicted nucleotidyltransferase component of viral defense system